MSSSWSRSSAALVLLALFAIPAFKHALATSMAEAELALVSDSECSAGQAGSQAECSLNALQQRKSIISARLQSGAVGCKSIEAGENAKCKKVVQWAASGGKNDPNAAEWWKELPAIAGVEFQDASVEDFQKLYFCSPPGGDWCGTPPCTCSHPPCDQCSSGQSQMPTRPGCASTSTSIKCRPPKTPFGYKGQAWPTMSIGGKREMHIFAIGDWGGMDGSMNPIEGRHPILAYEWGKRAGPSVFPRTRWNLMHDVQLCSHRQFIECFNSRGQPPCAEGCGYVDEIDSQPQQLVAKVFKERAAKMDPAFILNVGDNFYWGGIEKTCGTPMGEISYTAYHQFEQIFEQIYQGPGLSGKPWLSVLGNHDWGGRVFNNGWDQQIAYTWASDRWILPAPYWSQHVEFPGLGFSVDLYMFDSNNQDAKDPSADPEHNICGARHNPPGADCSIADGPSSVEACPQFFAKLWSEQQTWLAQKLSESKATWRILVTHFPCGHEQAFYSSLNSQFGVDLIVTGHRHDQELWKDTDKKNLMGTTCFVTGGGGGITSEATPDPTNQVDWYGEGQYGFYDLTIDATQILIESINWDGNVTASHIVKARR